MSDTANDNVISFGKYDPASRQSGNGPAIRALEEVRQLCRQRLARNVRYMMTKCDDALYGCAQLAESPMVQDLYLDAIHELKTISGDVEKLFIDRFVEQFNLGVPRHLQQWAGAEPVTQADPADSAYVRKEQASEDLAICKMIDKTRSECAEILRSLDRRMGFLMRDPDLELWQNPLNPEPICEAFRTAVTETVSRLNYGYEIRPILFTLFNEHVLGDMSEVYKALNLCLIQMGVQPELHSDAQRPDSSADSPEQPELLSNNAPLPRPEPGAYLRHVNAEPPLYQYPGAPGDVTFDVVALMFERILEDRNIAHSMRALLGRLQIPVIKIALRDPHFFSDKTHPARLLLNLLADSTTGWDENLGYDDPLYGKIDSIVQTLLDGSDNDTSLFKTLLEDLQAFLATRETQAGIKVVRSTRVQEGEERLEQARTKAMEQVKARIDSRRLPGFINDFVATHWKDLLLLIYARQGTESEEWKQALSTLDDLVWSIQPGKSSNEQQRLMTLQPALLNRLSEGMRRLSVPVTEQDEFVARLMHAHAGTLTGTKPAEPGTGPDMFITQARQLKKGSWIEIRGSDGKTRRAKLSWMSPITKTYLFTDQMGLNAGNYSIEELAELFRSGRARSTSGRC